MRRRVACGALALLLLGLSGCFDAREMNHLALVVAVGIDKADTPGRFLVTIQVARPGGQSGSRGGDTGGAGGAESVYLASAEGDTIYTAIRNLAQFVSRRLMWAHNNVVVVGEELARQDITAVMDFFTRNQELRMRTWMVIARGARASQIVTANTGIESVPANSISALFRYASLPGESVQTDINEVAASFFSPDVHTVVAAMSLRPRAYKLGAGAEEPDVPQAELAGTAIIHHSRLVGYVERETGRGLVWLRDEMRNAVLSVPCPKDRPGKISVEIRSPGVKVRSYLTGAAPSFRVQVRTALWITEQDCSTPSMTADQLKAYVSKAVAAKIRSEIQATLQVLQQDLKTDVIRYGRWVHVQHPAWWHTHRDRWEEIFPKVRTEIVVNVDIPKMGLYTLPTTVRSP